MLAFVLSPTFPWSLESVPLASLLAVEDLEVLVHWNDYPLADNPEDLVDYLEGEAS